MNSLSDKKADYFPTLVWVLAIIGGIGFLLSLTSMFSIGVSENSSQVRAICFSKECLRYFTETYSGSLEIAKATCDALVAFATVGGVLVAISSYRNTASTDALSNHIAHFSIFHDYLESEISKRDMIKKESINTRVWYNSIFPGSRQGSTEIAEDYIQFITELNLIIESSNLKAQQAKQGNFRYLAHQDQIISHTKKIGIDLYRLPRNTFFDMEEQLFSLIDNVNQSFSYMNTSKRLMTRRYI